MGNAWQEHVGTGLLVPGYGPRTGPTKQTKVITEEGPTRGQVGGVLTHHADGRQDATVFAPHNRATISAGDHGWNLNDLREIRRILAKKFGPGVRIRQVKPPKPAPSGLILNQKGTR